MVLVVNELGQRKGEDRLNLLIGDYVSRRSEEAIDDTDRRIESSRPL